MESKKLTDNDKIQAWQSLRLSIGVWDSVSASLSIGGPTLIFSAYGIVIAYSQNLGQAVSSFLSLALFFISLGVYFQVSKFNDASVLGVKRAMEIEDSLYGKNDSMLKITNMLTKNNSKSSSFYYNYYKVWGAGFVILSALLTLWRISILFTSL